MRRALGDGIDLDDDADRIDVAAVHDYLANESYWAKGRPYDVVARLVREAQRVVGLYDGQRQVGFARAFTDGVSLGVEVIREIVDNGPYADIRWVLHTCDASGLYHKFEFGEPSPRLMERYRREA